jgi:hypothetical protein
LVTEETHKTDIPHFGRNFAGRILPFAAAFALIGALPWIAESINPPARYPNLESAKSPVSNR